MPENYDISRVNFLIVDDNAHMCVLVRTILNSLGARSIQEAPDVIAALEMLRASPPDIVICDWNMAPMNGLEFVRWIRTDKESANPFLPVIMVTGHSEMERVREARDGGVNEFLAKPISANALYARIRSIIHHPRPFVRSATYFGPDRRRHNAEWKGPERRAGGAQSSDEGSVS